MTRTNICILVMFYLVITMFQGEVHADEPRELTLPQALALAVLENPELSAYSLQLRVREAEALQAGVRPNPSFGLEFENFAGTGEVRGLVGLETTLSLSQVFELGGKRGKRVALAEQEHQLASWDYESRKLDILADVVQGFVSVLAAQERIQISQDLVQVAELSLETVARRVRAGAVSSVEETRARVDVAAGDLELEKARRHLNRERRKLSSLWGSAEPTFDQALGDLDAILEPVPLEGLLQDLQENPDVARWDAEIERHHANIAVQRSLGAADFSLVGGLRHQQETSDRSFLLGIELPLMIADRNQAGSRAAEFELSMAQEEQRAARVTLETALAITHEAWSSAYQEIKTLDETILPGASLALETAQEAHQRGLFRLTDVLDTRRTLFQFRAQRIDALERYHHAQSRLERLIGDAFTKDGR